MYLYRHTVPLCVLWLSEQKANKVNGLHCILTINLLWESCTETNKISSTIEPLKLKKHIDTYTTVPYHETYWREQLTTGTGRLHLRSRDRETVQK